MGMGKTFGLAAAILLIGTWEQAFAQLKYAGCPDVTKADFRKVPLIKRSPHAIEEPIKMAVAKDGRIFWVERKGKVRMWEPTKADAAPTLVTLPVYTGSEFGATGIALDPGFASNNWVYVFWAMNAQDTDGSRKFRISRFTLAGSVLAGEKPILEIPFTNFGCCHTSGAMTFDLAGHLWIAVGNTTDNGIGEADVPKTNYVNQTNANGDDQRGSANTNSLLGKILRIKPKAIPDAGAAPAIGVGGTYDIPAGNLFPAGQYPAGKTRPEIYTMGHRNPYSIHVDPYRNWLTWGEIGPDEGLMSEEHNLVTKPGFMGWPYFTGNNIKFRGTTGIDAAGMDPAKPLNKSRNNTGLEELPPAQAAIRPYRQSAAITGPLYYYDGRLAATYRLPPHFNKKWMFSDFNAGWIRVASPAEDGRTLASDVEFFSGGYLSRPLNLEIGADGALYTLDYDGWFSAGTLTSINRIEYTGACVDKALVPPINSSAIRNARKANGVGQGGLISFNPRSGFMILPGGLRSLELFDLKGTRVFAFDGTDGNPMKDQRVEIPGHLRNSLLRARFGK